MILTGGYSKEVTPDPIPNSEVKLFSVDGTACRLWESRSPPVFFLPALYECLYIFARPQGWAFLWAGFVGEENMGGMGRMGPMGGDVFIAMALNLGRVCCFFLLVF